MRLYYYYVCSVFYSNIQNIGTINITIIKFSPYSISILICPQASSISTCCLYGSDNMKYLRAACAPSNTPGSPWCQRQADSRSDGKVDWGECLAGNMTSWLRGLKLGGLLGTIHKSQTILLLFKMSGIMCLNFQPDQSPHTPKSKGGGKIKYKFKKSLAPIFHSSKLFF